MSSLDARPSRLTADDRYELAMRDYTWERIARQTVDAYEEFASPNYSTYVLT